MFSLYESYYCHKDKIKVVISSILKRLGRLNPTIDLSRRLFS